MDRRIKITYKEILEPHPENLLERDPFKKVRDEFMSIAIASNNKYFATGGAAGLLEYTILPPRLSSPSAKLIQTASSA